MNHKVIYDIVMGEEVLIEVNEDIRRVKVSVDKCPAGPEMDAAIAKARGWEKVECDGLWYWADPAVDEWHTNRVADSKNVHGYELEDTHVWSPSTNITDAWELAEILRREFTFDITSSYKHSPESNKVEWGAFFLNDETAYVGYASDAPHAISRAFLNAKGIEHIEVNQ